MSLSQGRCGLDIGPQGVMSQSFCLCVHNSAGWCYGQSEKLIIALLKMAKALAKFLNLMCVVLLWGLRIKFTFQKQESFLFLPNSLHN